MRPIPQSVIDAASEVLQQRASSAWIRNRYKHAYCYRLALELYRLDPTHFVPYSVCNYSYESYDAHLDWLSAGGDGPRPLRRNPQGHAFVVVMHTDLALDIEGLRTIKQLRNQAAFDRFRFEFPVHHRDWDMFTETDNAALDRAVAQATFDYWMKDRA
jgi:hypothetical protein